MWNYVKGTGHGIRCVSGCFENWSGVVLARGANVLFIDDKHFKTGSGVHMLYRAKVQIKAVLSR